MKHNILLSIAFLLILVTLSSCNCGESSDRPPLYRAGDMVSLRIDPVAKCQVLRVFDNEPRTIRIRCFETNERKAFNVYEVELQNYLGN